jgi:hypothetical protein
MSNTDKLREIATRHFPVEEKLSNNSLYNQLQQSSQDNLLSDLNALLEQHNEMMMKDELVKFYKWIDVNYALGMLTEKVNEVVGEYLKNVKR